MISLRRNFLFVHIPKTAGNAVQNILRQYSEDSIVCLAPYQDGVERFEIHNERFRIRKHSTLEEYRRELGDQVLACLFKFCCVRNPWERAISYYFSPHRQVTAWDRTAFVDLIAQIAPSRDFVSLEGAGSNRLPFENVNFIMRYERLEDDFKQVCARIGIPHELLPIRNKSSREHFSRYYDAELVELVRCRFADEIREFGYEF